MKTIKIKCSICKYNYLSKFPSTLNKEEMDFIEKRYACFNCIKEGRKRIKRLESEK